MAATYLDFWAPDDAGDQASLPPGIPKSVFNIAHFQKLDDVIPRQSLRRSARFSDNLTLRLDAAVSDNENQTGVAAPGRGKRSNQRSLLIVIVAYTGVLSDARSGTILRLY